MFDKYDYFALPVVDHENRLVGIITVDDAIDVLQDEVEEDFEKMAAITPTEEGYFQTSVFKHAKSRILWLLILMLSSAFTGNILTKYEDAFAVEAKISADDSKVLVYVVPTNEELMIAKETERIVNGK